MNEEKRKVWVLTMVDDSQPIGEKTTVSVHGSFQSAKGCLLTEMEIIMRKRQLDEVDVEMDWDALYGQSKDKINCWFMEEFEV